MLGQTAGEYAGPETVTDLAIPAERLFGHCCRK
jgi:hypothetical protein